MVLVLKETGLMFLVFSWLYIVGCTDLGPDYKMKTSKERLKGGELG